MRTWMRLEEIQPHPQNPRVFGKSEIEEMARSLTKFPEMYDIRPMVVQKKGYLLAGHLRLEALRHMANNTPPLRGDWIEVDLVDWPEAKQQEFIIRDNTHGGRWDYDTIANVFPDEAVLQWGVVVRDLEPDICFSCKRPY